MPTLTRRSFSGSLLMLQAARAQSPVLLEPVRTISRQDGLYHGWPTLARRRNGDLMLAWSGGREAHVCPFGRVDLMFSRDEGRTWTWPRTILDSDLDDRDAGSVETPQGTLLVTTFTSLAYEPLLAGAQSQSWPPDKVERWEAIQRRLPDALRKAQLGCWMMRSVDGGASWSAQYRVPVNSPHGPVVLRDGRLLYAGKDLWGDGSVGVCVSSDDGRTWRWLARFSPRTGDTVKDYHELHAAETASGRIVVHIRNHNPEHRHETLQMESNDGGRTWTSPHPIGVWGLPSHLLVLRDGRLLMSYGYRREPFGNEARVSEDEGRTWSRPFKLSSDGFSTDLGYPSTVQLGDGTLLTVWYEKLRSSPHAVLRQARWRLP